MKAAPPRLFGLWPVVILLLCGTVIVLQRLHTYTEPLENDIAGYAIIGHEMMHGRHLYSDLWERKPPLLYAIFAGAELVAGYGRGEVFLVNVIAAIITLIAVYIAGASGLQYRRGGWIAAVLWTLLCGDLFMQANQPNAEVLLNVFLSSAFALLICWPQKRGRWLAAITLGILFSAATLIKHHVIITCTILSVAHIFNGPNRRRRILEMVAASAVIITIWGALLAYFAAVDRWQAMADALFHQNAVYAGGLLHNLLVSLSRGNLFRPFLIWILAPILALVVFAFFTPKRGIREIHPQWILWCAWVLGTWPAVVLPGHLFPHYYQLWIPVWCVAGAWALAGILDLKIPFPGIIRYPTVAAVFMFLTWRELSPYGLTPDQWSDRKYPGGNYVQQEYLGRYLGDSLLKPNEQFWILGDDNSIYFAAKKSPPSGLLYVDPLIDGDEKTIYNQRLVRDLQRTNPVLVILSPLTERMPPDAPVFDWIKKNYKPWYTPIGQPKYLMFTRNGSDLPHR